MAINGVVAFVELLLDPEASKRIQRALSTLILASLSWKINIYPAILCRYFLLSCRQAASVFEILWRRA